MAGRSHAAGGKLDEKSARFVSSSPPVSEFMIVSNRPCRLHRGSGVDHLEETLEVRVRMPERRAVKRREPLP